MSGSDSAPPALARVGPYEIRGTLGRGGMGLVFRAEHAEHRVPTALKLVRAGAASVPALRAEIRAVAGLDHPNIVRILDHGAVTDDEAAALGQGLEGGTPWLAMELATDGTVARQTLPWDVLSRLLLQVLDALAHAHARGVLHRDLKLGNLLRTRRPEDPEIRVVLTDFGLAHSLDDLQRAAPAGISGTPAYMAPEQFRDDRRSFGPWTDLYALGCVAWKLLTGRAPFAGRPVLDMARAHHVEPLPSLRGIELPASAHTWLQGMLAKHPAERFQCAADAAAELLAVRPAGQVSAGVATEVPQQTLVLAELATVLLSRAAPERAVRAEGSGPPPAPMAGSWARARPPPPPLRWLGAGLRLFGLRRPPSVGRSSARDELWAALSEVHRTGRSQGVLLVSPSGGGRSHLGGWVLERAAELGAALPLRIGATEAPEVIAARWLRAGGLAEDELAAHLEQLLPEAALAPARALLAMDSTLRLDNLSERHGALAAVLVAGRARPVALLVDDVAASEDRVALVRDLLGTGAGLLVVATVEDALLGGEEPAVVALRRLSAAGTLRELHLAPLDTQASFALLEASLPLDPVLGGRLVDRAQGSPGVLVQTLASLVASDALEPGEAGFQLRTGAEIRLPTALAAVWAARLGHALAERSPEEVAALQVLGALGAEVDERLWATACGELGLAMWWVAAEHLADQRLLSRTDAGVLVWAHPTLAEAAGRGASHAVHAACARAWAPTDGFRSALHLLEAGEAEQALPLLEDGFRAAFRLGARARSGTSVEAYARGLAMLSLPEGHPHRVRHLVMRADLQMFGALFEAAEATADAAVAEAMVGGSDQSLAEALKSQLKVARALGRTDQVLRVAAACLRSARAAGARDIVAGVYLERANALSRFGELEDAVADYALARATFEELGDPFGVAKTWLGEGGARGARGDRDGSAYALERAEAAFEALGARWGVAMARSDRSEIHRQRGATDLARAGYEHAISLFEDLGHLDVAFPRIGLALVLQGSGDHHRALSLLDQAAAAFPGRALQPLVRMLRLPSLVHVGAGEAFDATLRDEGAALVRSGIQDEDLVRSVAAAARAARERGWLERAEKAQALHDQLRGQ